MLGCSSRKATLAHRGMSGSCASGAGANRLPSGTLRHARMARCHATCPTLDLVTIRGPEEPQIVFAQPELPLPEVEALNAIQSVELWLARNQESGDDLNLVTAQLHLVDTNTRLSREALAASARDQRAVHA